MNEKDITPRELDDKTLEELKLIFYNFVFIENYDRAKLTEYVMMNMNDGPGRAEFMRYVNDTFIHTLKTDKPTRKQRRRTLILNGHTFKNGLKKLLKRAELAHK